MSYTDENPLKRVDKIFAAYAEEISKRDKITFIQATRIIAETAKTNGTKTVYIKTHPGRPTLLDKLL